MTITITIDLEIPRWLRRSFAIVCVPLIVLGATTLVLADVSVPYSFAEKEIVSSKKINDNFKALQEGINSLIPAGTIIAYGGASAPDGWLLCDGLPYNQTAYSRLHSAIGTAYGKGDNTAGSFNVPDMRGMFLRGVDHAAGNDPDASSRTAVNGGNSGDSVGSYELDGFAAHRHNLKGVSGSGTWSNASLYYHIPTQDSIDPATYQEVVPWMSFYHMSMTGGSETRPKNVNVNYLIKY